MKTTPLLTPTVSTAAGDQGTTSQKMDAPAGSGFTEHLQEASKALEADSKPQGEAGKRPPPQKEEQPTASPDQPQSLALAQGHLESELPGSPSSSLLSQASGQEGEETPWLDLTTASKPEGEGGALLETAPPIQGAEPSGGPALAIDLAPETPPADTQGPLPLEGPPLNPSQTGTVSPAMSDALPMDKQSTVPLKRAFTPSQGSATPTLSTNAQATSATPPSNPGAPWVANTSDATLAQGPGPESANDTPLEKLATLENAPRLEKGGEGTPLERPRFDLAQGTGRAATIQSPVTTAGTTTQAAPLMEGQLDPPVGHQAWAKSLANQALVLADREGHRARLRLNPEHLGSLDVQLTLKENEARIHFGSHQLPVREALEQALPRLRDAFNAAGMELVEVDISRHGLGDGGQGEPQGEPRGQGAWDAPDGHPELAEAPVSLPPMGLIDYYI